MSTAPGAADGLPEIAADQLRLTDWRVDDHPELLAVAADPQIQRFSSLGGVRTLAEVADWVATRRAPGRMDWAVRDAASDQLLGRVGLMNLHLDDDVAEIGYWTVPEARGRGVASESVALVTHYGFAVLRRHRLEICHEPENTASCRVAARNGFVVEGVLRDAHRSYDGETFADLELHARLATDPPSPVDTHVSHVGDD